MNESLEDRADSAARPPALTRHYKYSDILLGAAVAVLLCANLIGPGKTVAVTLPWGQPWTFGAGNIFFPISYIFGDVFTEVYGYARARRVIWVGFGAMGFAVIMSAIILRLPPDMTEPYNLKLDPALHLVFANTWRISLASLCAYWVGDFVNSYVLARMKLITKGRFLWTRTIGSTVAGQSVDSIIFYPLSFYGLWRTETLLHVTIANCLFKISVEVLFTPLTYLIVHVLKRAEHEDYFDHGTDFNPFTLEE